MAQNSMLPEREIDVQWIGASEEYLQGKGRNGYSERIIQVDKYGTKYPNIEQTIG